MFWYGGALERRSAEEYTRQNTPFKLLCRKATTQNDTYESNNVDVMNECSEIKVFDEEKPQNIKVWGHQDQGCQVHCSPFLLGYF